MGPGKAVERRAAPIPARQTYDPPGQIESLLLRAVLADLKASGWSQASISNKRKRGLGERSRRETAPPLRSITDFLRISKGSHEYRGHRLADADPGRNADIRGPVRDAFEASGRSPDYREAHARLRQSGRFRRREACAGLCARKGLKPAYARCRRRGRSSYEGEASKTPAGLANKGFRASPPQRATAHRRNRVLPAPRARRPASPRP